MKYFFKYDLFINVKVVPEVNLNEESNSDLEFDLDNNLQGYLKINLIFWGETLFFHSGNWKSQIFLNLIMNLGHKSDINLKVIVRLLKSNQDMRTFKNKSYYENFLSSKVIYFMRRTR